MLKCDILRSIFRARRGQSAGKKSNGMLQTFSVRFSIKPIHFQCIELGQQLD